MPKFKYTAVNPEGARVRGVTEAASETGAKTALLQRDLKVVKVKEQKGILQLELTRKKIPREEIMHLSRQLASFIRAGIPILDAIQVIAEETGNAVLRKVLLDVGDALRGGAPFADAIAAHREMFPPYYAGILRSAEMTGRLDTVLEQLSRYMERDLEARKKIRSAMAYPAVILVMSVVTVAILTAFVLPRFRRFFESLDAELPVPTRILLNVANTLSDLWFVFLGGIVALILGIYSYFRTARGREVRDRMLLRFPVAGDIVRYAVIERFTRILGSMAQAGVPLPEGLRIAGEGSNNRVYEGALVGVREEMVAGEGLARPLARTGLFPPSVIQMVRVGEDTGTLDQQLEQAARFHEVELDYKIKRMTTLFEPAVIVFMGLIVGFVAVALISAMYGIFRQAGKLG